MNTHKIISSIVFAGAFAVFAGCTEKEKIASYSEFNYYPPVFYTEGGQKLSFQTDDGGNMCAMASANGSDHIMVNGVEYQIVTDNGRWVARRFDGNSGNVDPVTINGTSGFYIVYPGASGTEFNTTNGTYYVTPPLPDNPPMAAVITTNNILLNPCCCIINVITQSDVPVKMSIGVDGSSAARFVKGGHIDPVNAVFVDGDELYVEDEPCGAVNVYASLVHKRIVLPMSGNQVQVSDMQIDVDGGLGEGGETFSISDPITLRKGYVYNIDLTRL